MRCRLGPSPDSLRKGSVEEEKGPHARRLRAVLWGQELHIFASSFGNEH